MLTAVPSTLFNTANGDVSVFTSLQSAVRQQQQLQNTTSNSALNLYSPSSSNTNINNSRNIASSNALFGSNVNNTTSQSSTILQFHQQCQQQQQQQYTQQQPQTRSLAPLLTSVALTMSSPTTVLHNSMQNNQQKHIGIDNNSFSHLGKNLPLFGKSLSPHHPAQILTPPTSKKSLGSFTTQNDLLPSTVANNYSSTTEQLNFKVCFGL